MEFTKTFYELVKYKDIPIKIVVGGTRSGKTIGIVQYLYLKYEKHNELTSIVSESLPHMKKGAFRDFKTILKTDGIELTRENFNKADYIYKEGLEFFGLDSSEKAHGPARKNLFANEIQNLAYDTVFHLMSRTEGEVILDFNPVGDFWVYPEIIENPAFKEGVDFVIIHSTIEDNPFISDNIKKLVYARASTDENYRRVYLLGLKGVMDGLIFPTFKLVDEMPKEYKRLVYGQDYGFTNDPTTMIDCRLASGELWFDELIYNTGLVNLPSDTDPSIVESMQSLEINKRDLIIGDSAEPKTIKDLRNAGYNIKGALKGKDSINFGINKIKEYKINITKRSVNLIKELRNYQYIIDKDGHVTNKPKDQWNHCLDAMRYAVQEMFGGFNTNMQVRL